MDATPRRINVSLIPKHNYCTPEMLSREISIIRLLIRDGANVNVTNQKNQTALMLTRDKKVIQFLIDNGANINTHDINGKTPLMYAKTLDIVQILVSNGANINAQDNYGNIALMYAKSKAIIEYYISCGVNLYIQNNEKKTGYEYIVKYLPNLIPIYIRSDTELNFQICAICLENLSSDACKLTKCSHYFHIRCIDSWIKIKFTCPNCRQDLRNSIL